MVVWGYISQKGSTWILWIASVNNWSITPSANFIIFLYFVFKNQPNLVVDSVVHIFLHPNCHHHITFSWYNLNIEYPQPYEKLVWDYNKANRELIKQSLMQINWENPFLNKDVHQQARKLNDIIINFFLNFGTKQDDMKSTMYNWVYKNKSLTTL